MAHASIIELSRVTKTYGQTDGSRPNGLPALSDVSLRIGKGEFALLMGPSGAGKSTLLKLILAMEQPDRGTIRVAGRDVHRLTKGSIPYLRRNLGAVFQDFKLLPEATPLENVRLTLQVLGLRGRDVLSRAKESLERVGLDPNSRKPVRCLSGGEQQRVALARALANRPPVLLADEPTGNLDPALTLDILRQLELIRAAGTTILLATHDPLVFRHAPASRILHLEMGRLIEDRVVDRAPNFTAELDAFGEPIDALAAIDDDEFCDEPVVELRPGADANLEEVA
ncbi:ABC transporter, ATPase subunit [Plesiocystis pacifica SIR-1]|uniref:Cell division ATP-binding protein FtsE n=1 Tax=Plesiocystis pacifica SIR-1 TaxID=391625 RepID=A6G1T3_9BACT|nr:ATP-binding cassette domain-containing protein [Plesiocystis pacifica]EDM80123.1 ABC transporter, ATPase subunit [Plesiocystis pacifica SIR-1]